MKTLLLIRHGETDVNNAGKIHIQDDTAGLTEKGRVQALDAGKICQQENVEVIYTSSELRAKQTAEIIASRLGLVVEVKNNLRERNWGQWRDLSWDEIKTRLERMTINERYIFIPPQGESWEQMEKRLQNELEILKLCKEQAIAVVTHGGAIRGLIPLILNINKVESFNYDPNNGELLIFDYDGTSFRQR